jgi:ankyrin repeat protein/beta-lactamase regulating signal transducer with metallopeptidase domain
MMPLLVKSTVVLLAALLFVALARRGRASLRHLILAAVFAFLLLLPLVQRVAPAVDIPVASMRIIPAATPTVATIAAVPRDAIRPHFSTARRFDWRAIVINAYAAVAVSLLLLLAIGVIRLRLLARRGEVWLEGTARMNEIAQVAAIRRSALVILSAEVLVPLTFGFRRSVIVLPHAARDWTSDALTRALRHELEHVRRDDWALQLVARVSFAVYWFHPLIWIAWRRFCVEAERACDDAVVSSDVVVASSEPAAYADQLIALARGIRGITSLPALGMASRSRLAQRIDAILDPRQLRGPHGPLSTAVVLVVVLAFLVGVAPARLIEAAVAEARLTSAPDDARLDSDLTSPLGEALVKAAERGDVAAVRRLLDTGVVDVNHVAHGDGTALIGAARGGQRAMAELLLARGADPNLESRGDGNPLIAAARRGHTDMIELLLDRGAVLDRIVPGEENALMQAAWHGHVDAVRVLIRRGADVNARAYERDELRTPLRLARRGRHAEIARMLLAAGARE